MLPSLCLVTALLSLTAPEDPDDFFEPPPVERLPRVAVQPTPTELRIDGRALEAFWQTQAPVQSLVQVEPFQGQPARHATRVWLFADERGLAVAARLEQPAHLAPLSQRDMRRDFAFICSHGVRSVSVP